MAFADSNYISFTTISAADGNADIPKILRNTDPSNTTVRLLSKAKTKEETKGTTTYTYEYFSDVHNVTVACDDGSPETLIAWEGIKGTATLTCTWTEKDKEEKDCEKGQKDCTCTGEGKEEKCQAPNPDYGKSTSDDLYTDDLKLDPDPEDVTTHDKVHIYALFDNNIPLTDIHAQRLDASETAAHYPSTAFEPVGRKFLVAWETRQENGFSKIYGQLFLSGGTSYGPNLPLSFQDIDGDGNQDENILRSNQTHPSITVDYTNQLFLVTWQDGRNAPVSAENLDIYGQFVDCEGSLRGSNYAINTNAANQCCPRTAYNLGTHQFFMVWKDARNFLDTHSDIYGQRFDLADLQVYNNGQAATQIILSDSGSNATFSPLSLGFPTLEVDSRSTRNITVKNTSAATMIVESFRTTAGVFSASGITTGDEIPAGGGLTFSVIFSPTHLGNFDDTLSLVFISQTGGTAIPCAVNLSGKAIGKYILYEAESFTADRTYQLKVNAFTEQPGHLYVLLIHDPASGGTIYALTPTGNIVPFPYTSPFDWQDMYFAFESSPSMTVDLSTINLQQLGCSACPGPFAVNAGDDSFMFGNNIIIHPPDETPYNCAADFKYFTGNFYVATYIADGTAGVPFDFNRGLVELLWLKIHSLNGSWRVTSEYYDQNRVHPALLQVQESGGMIASQWGDYHPTISYSTTESAYTLDFTMSRYHYTYTINQLTADSFTGTYHCEYNGTVIVEQAGVSGVRVQ